MGAVLRPIGPHPPAVYWRRRAALAALLALLLLFADRALGADGSTADQTPAASAHRPGAAAAVTPSATPAATRPAGSAAPAACPDRAIAVTVGTDATRYPKGATPRLRISVRNTSAVACRRDVGPRGLGLVVASGRDRIWSSDDCQARPPAQPLLLRPGQVVTQTVPWPRRRSAPGCRRTGTAAGVGTYTLVGHADAARSARVVFHLA